MPPNMAQQKYFANTLTLGPLGAKMTIGTPPEKHYISGSSLNRPKATLERPLDGFGGRRRGQGSSLSRSNVPKTLQICVFREDHHFSLKVATRTLSGGT